MYNQMILLWNMVKLTVVKLLRFLLRFLGLSKVPEKSNLMKVPQVVPKVPKQPLFIFLVFSRH